jgi:hypothetical protein
VGSPCSTSERDERDELEIESNRLNQSSQAFASFTTRIQHAFNTAALDHTMKAFKVTLHGTDTTRIVPSPDPHGSCWFNLSETIRERFTLSPDLSFEFKYIDNDGDSITAVRTHARESAS